MHSLTPNHLRTPTRAPNLLFLLATLCIFSLPSCSASPRDDDDDSAPGDDDDSANVPYPAGVFINEIHYDNTGVDIDEGVEIAGPAGIDLTGWSLLLYDGADGTVYDTIPLSGIIDDEVDGFGAVNFLISGIEDGAPDGITLLDDGGLFVEAVGYEGSFAATEGGAFPLSHQSLGFEESPDAPPGLSLQRTGTGCFDRHQIEPCTFVWAGPTAHSRGQINAGQVFDCDF